MQCVVVVVVVGRGVRHGLYEVCTCRAALLAVFAAYSCIYFWRMCLGGYSVVSE